MIDKFEGEYRFLSNFSPHAVRGKWKPSGFDQGVLWPTAEHAFQAAKTNDPKEKLKIAIASTPGKAKSLGQSVTLRPDWDKVKVDIMLQVVRAKFAQHDDIAAKLKATGNSPIVEGNMWHDNYWGSCTCHACIHIQGQNYLGRTLMLVRMELMPWGSTYS